jgi:MerR family transcriptional regulator, light-induced transcriptional regulator
LYNSLGFDTEMNTESAAAETAGRRRYPIGTVSSLTGIPPITLRAWERRYGLIHPLRKPSGHRLYSREDIDLIHRVVVLLEGGMRIGQVKEQLIAEPAQLEEAKPSTVWDSYRNDMIAAIIRFNERRLETAYGNALALHPVEAVTRKLLTPLLIELGDRWQRGEGSIAEEHFFAFYLRNTLGARFHHRQRDTSGRKILAACLPGEHHEIGLLLFGLAAHQAGFQLVLLGADMPMSDLALTAATSECEAIVLAGAIKPEASVIEEDLPRLIKEADLPVLVGGLTSVDCHDAIAKAGAIPLGNDIDQGLRRLIETLRAESSS